MLGAFDGPGMVSLIITSGTSSSTTSSSIVKEK